MKKEIKYRIVFALLGVLMLCTACLPGGGNYSPEYPAGFFTGIWHGWIAPISLVLSIFNKDITLYESFNTGWWYDFGFYMAIISGFGSLRLIRNKTR
ncbi:MULTISPECIES: hypothetical protein [unclassified Carboxylicivirga]|uniref:hypothetical protein n=1 Tax=Carboxylicivirga TaxID=1628153 RepID=UPI003D336F9F